MSNNNMNKGTQIGIIIGGALILYGAYQLLKVLLGPVWYIVNNILRLASTIAWPILIVAAGAFLIWKATKGGFAHTSGAKLYRSTQNRWVSGVLGGFGEYFGFDPTFLRIAYIVFLCASFWLAALIYVIMIVVIPENPVISTS